MSESVPAKVAMWATKTLGPLDPVVLRDGEYASLQLHVRELDGDGNEWVLTYNVEVHLQDDTLTVVTDVPVTTYTYGDWLGE